jgi:hypothetical protein
VVDWAGHDGMITSDRYRSMGISQTRGISPSYERLCLGVADDAVVLDLLDTLPAPKRQPNLLLGAVRFLDGPVSSYDGFRSFVLSHWDEVSATMLARRTQTNEPGRCTALLPVLAALPQPLALLEVGASAGLCLYPDRYAYRYGDRPVLGSSSLELSCRITGPVPVPERLPSVVWRAGLDLNPLDVRSEDDVRWLRSLIWPEQIARFKALSSAVAIARAEPVTIRSGDLTVDLSSVASTAPRNSTLVVFHSAVLAYLDDSQRAAFRASLEALARSRPTVWVSNEGPGVCVDVPVPDSSVPFVLARDGMPLAYTSPHGEWVDWFAGR